ncbi:DUF732 domain-containing protein [Pseudosporangium ferrugineum]|uniref:DUF732 domain-containing protein n=1 Tax=Pseudosporangium ferrugineum TaxID=439699 RepID=A0A2T0SJ69_9ACTN|nr:DUF732 domain-containing protein [Pseudosporangium ferrugineum]PRY33460.1 hypothetical protein CLV70_101623 [Pseudosporangium ferrugineum]
MKRIWWAATVLLLATGGCSSGGEAEPATVPVPVTTATTTGGAPSRALATESTPAANRPRAPEPAAADPGAFIGTFREKLPELALDRRDDEIALIAEQACASLAANAPAGTVVAGTRSLGTIDAEATDQATAREIIKLAIDTACPGQSRRVTEF